MGDTGFGQKAAQATVIERLDSDAAEHGRLFTDVAGSAGGNDPAFAVDQHGFKIVGKAVRPAKILHVSGFDGGESNTGKTALIVVDAPGQRVGIASGDSSDKRAKRGRILSFCKSFEIFSVGNVQTRGGKIG